MAQKSSASLSSSAEEEGEGQKGKGPRRRSEEDRRWKESVGSIWLVGVGMGKSEGVKGKKNEVG